MKRTGNNNKKKGQQVVKHSMVIVEIPNWKSEPILSRKMRFKALSAISGAAITWPELASAVTGVIATAATTSVHVAVAIRIRRVDIYFSATAAGTITEAIIDWDADTGVSVYSPNSSTEATTASIADIKHLSCVPPANSQASMWQYVATAATSLKLSVPASAVVDITVDYVFNDSDSAIAGPALSGATLGTIYHKQPDTNLSVMGNLNTIA